MAFETAGEAALAEVVDGDAVELPKLSFDAWPLVSVALAALGLVMVMADFCTVREAIALARARW